MQQILGLSQEEFEKPITDKYADELSEVPPEDLIPAWNPGISAK